MAASWTWKVGSLVAGIGWACGEPDVEGGSRDGLFDRKYCDWQNLSRLGAVAEGDGLCCGMLRGAKRFPDREGYGVTSQLQRAAVFVPANVAEGHSRQHRTEFIQHLCIAYGSLAELETHVQIAQRLKYLSTTDAGTLLGRAGEVGRLLNGLLRYLLFPRRPTSDVPNPTLRRQPTSDVRNPTA
jgi:four helix bundle protein